MGQPCVWERQCLYGFLSSSAVESAHRHACIFRRTIIEHLAINNHYIASNMSFKRIICNRMEWLVAAKKVNTYYRSVAYIHFTIYHKIRIHRLENLIGFHSLYFGITFTEFFRSIFLQDEIKLTISDEKKYNDAFSVHLFIALDSTRWCCYFVFAL